MEFDLNKFVRPNILELQPYTSLREKFEGKDLILLEANESPFGEFNRYPDSQQIKLKTKLAEINGVNSNQLFLGNGSDELIDLIIRAFCEPVADSILVMEPSFVMYQFYAKVNNVKVEKLVLNEDFEIDKTNFDEVIKLSPAKLLFLCSPNNPTGNSIEDLEDFISKFAGIVIVDEAYIEFSAQESATKLLNKYPNLIVLKTLSKAYGMAGLRIGVGFASIEIASLINTLKPPYNVSSESQNKALKALNSKEEFENNLLIIEEEKNKLENALKEMECVEKIFPSDANFFLIEFSDAEKVYKSLLENDILTSLRHPGLKNCLRIGIGLPEENLKLIDVLRNHK